MGQKNFDPTVEEPEENPMVHLPPVNCDTRAGKENCEVSVQVSKRIRNLTFVMNCVDLELEPIDTGIIKGTGRTLDKVRNFHIPEDVDKEERFKVLPTQDWDIYLRRQGNEEQLVSPTEKH